MQSVGSVTKLITDVQRGSEAAASELWGRFRVRLLNFARSRLRGSSTTVADEEDVVVKTFQSFLNRTGEGSYPTLGDRDELWRLLVTIAAHKTLNQLRDQKCAKRTPQRPHDSSVLSLHSVPIVSSVPTPEFAATMNDQLTHFLNQLDDTQLRQIVLLRLQGYSHQEIANQIDVSLATVNRRMKLIREKWKLEYLA